MDTDLLQQTARKMVAPGKGILAADESHPTIGKRFGALGIEASEENRRARDGGFLRDESAEPPCPAEILGMVEGGGVQASL